MQGVGTQLEESSQLARRGRGPEGEFLHERAVLASYEGPELGVEVGEVGM